MYIIFLFDISHHVKSNYCHKYLPPFFFRTMERCRVKEWWKSKKQKKRKRKESIGVCKSNRSLANLREHQWRGVVWMRIALITRFDALSTYASSNTSLLLYFLTIFLTVRNFFFNIISYSNQCLEFVICTLNSFE
jgi:hypothetical protein